MSLTIRGLDVLDVLKHIIETGIVGETICPLITTAEWNTVRDNGTLPVFYAEYDTFSTDYNARKRYITLTFGVLYDNSPIYGDCDDPEFNCPKSSEANYYLSRLYKLLEEIIGWLVDDRKDPCTRKPLGTCIRLVGTSRIVFNNYPSYQSYNQIVLRGRGANEGSEPFGSHVGILESIVSLSLPMSNICINEVFPTSLPDICAPVNATPKDNCLDGNCP